MKPNDTINELKRQIQHKTLIAMNNQTLCFDRAGKEAIPNGANTLQSLGVQHGQMLYLFYSGERPISSSNAPKKLKDIKKQWDLKSLMEHLDQQGLVFKSQELTHCKTAALDFASCDKFQQYVGQFGFQRRREGYLYGRFESDGNVTVEYIYEPPQEHSPCMAVIKKDPQEEALVASIADALGVQMVGWIFTVPANEERDYIISSFELLRAAQFHLKAIQQHPGGKSFITVKASADKESQVHFEAFQVTDQLLRLVEKDLIKPPKEPKFISAREEVIMARAGAGRKDSCNIETDVLIKPIAVTNHTGSLACNFVIENRPEHPQNLGALKRHLLKFKQQPFLLAISDFHLIHFLGKRYLSPETDIPALCEAVSAGDCDALEGFKLLIHSIAGIP